MNTNTPLAPATQLPLDTATAHTKPHFVWSDEAWMTRRAHAAPHAEPLSIYELDLGAWRAGLGFREIAAPLITHVRATGFTHVEFLPLAESPGDDAAGDTPALLYGEPDDLRFLVDQLHQAGIGVLMDWVPGNAPTASALHWLSEFHLDGLRVDAVAAMLYLDHSRGDGQWTPNIHGGRENLAAIRLLQELNAAVTRAHPGVLMIAEESTGFPGVTARADHAGLGFGAKWNTAWANTSLRYMQRDPIHRALHEGEITFSFVDAFSEHFVLPLSHKKLGNGKGSLLAKMPGTADRALAAARAYLGFMWAHPGKKLLFMGQEFGALAESSPEREHDGGLREQSGPASLERLISDLNRIYRAQPALWQRDGDATSLTRIGGPHHDPTVVAFVRRDYAGASVLCVSNFADTERHGVELDLPLPGVWEEILHTDAAVYGGHQEGTLGIVVARTEGGVHRARLNLPALGTLWLRHQPDAHVPTINAG